MTKTQATFTSSSPPQVKQEIDALVDHRFRVRETIERISADLAEVPGKLTQACRQNAPIPQLDASTAKHYPDYAAAFREHTKNLARIREAIGQRDQAIHENERMIAKYQVENLKLRKSLIIAGVVLFPICFIFYFAYQKFRKKIEPLEAQIQQLQQETERLSQQLQQQVRTATDGNARAIAMHDSNGQKHLLQNALQLREKSRLLPLPIRGCWDDPEWDNWKCMEFDETASFFAVGTEREEGGREGGVFEIPVLVPFLGGDTNIVLEGEPDQTTIVMHAMIMQAAIMLPHKIRFTFLDPAGQGSAFPMQRKLPLVRKAADHLYQTLDAINEDIQRINVDYLDEEVHSFNELSEKVQANERYELVVAAGFPEEYDRRSIEALKKISRNGPKTGKYVLIQKTAAEMPREMSLTDFFNLEACHLDYPSRPGLLRYPIVKIPRTLQQHFYDDLQNAEPPEHTLNWQDIALDVTNWWSQSSRDLIEVPIGSAGTERELEIWFGQKKNGQQCSHGVLGAMTGSGKSVLFHAIISGLATRYSPSEVQLYLVDGKQGVSFQSYRSLPHARVVSLHSLPEFSRSILRELRDEMERRFDLFKAAQVSDLSEYRRAGNEMPRIVLLADEYSEFFERDRDDTGSQLILQLAQQGRAAGIHMLLGGQTFSGGELKSRNEVFANIHMRLGMKQKSSVQTEFGPEGKRLIDACDLAGKIVVNDQSGNDGGNEMGKVAMISREERNAVVSEVVKLAERTLAPDQRASGILFEGNRQPFFSQLPTSKRLLNSANRLSAEEWRTMATTSVHQIGLGIPDWFEGEFPVPLWIGQEFNLHGHAFALLRRRASENALIVGDSNAARFGMLMSSLCSIALRWDPAHASVIVMDRSVPGTPWSNVLAQTVAQVCPHNGVVVKESEEITQHLAKLCEIVKTRGELSEKELQQQPSIYLILSDPDRVSALQLVPNKYGSLSESDVGETLKEIYTRGPVVGVHVITTTSALLSMTQVIPRRNLEQHFKHRIALQMSEDDSFTFVRSRVASQLQPVSTPICAYYVDILGGRKSRLKPFVISTEEDITPELDAVSSTLRRWNEVVKHGNE